jgi:hypothetical protein
VLAVIGLLALYPQGALKRSERSAEASVATAHADLTTAAPTPVAATEP